MMSSEGRTSTEHFALDTKIAIEALRSLLLVNGGAATALIALTAKTQGGPEYGLPVLLFGFAALLNAITLVIGYFSQLAYANHVLAIENSDLKNAQKQLGKHGVKQWAAIATLAVSLAVSVGGMYTAFRVTSAPAAAVAKQPSEHLPSATTHSDIAQHSPAS